MNKTKKFLSLCLAALMVTPLIACGGGGGGDDSSSAGGGGSGGGDRPNKLYIGNYDGAAGHEWLNYYEQEFEKIHTDVDVIQTNKKDEFQDTALMNSVLAGENDMYFTDHSDYRQFANAGVMEDITDVVTGKFYTADGELAPAGQGTHSIIDRMMPEYIPLYNLGTEQQPLYYGVPEFYNIAGFNYDADLFNEKDWFFDADGDIGVKDTDPNVGPGPDGISGNADDGEPETWEDFVELLEAIRGSGNVTPFTWSGHYAYPRQYVLNAVRAQYEGKANMDVFYSLNGTHSEVGEVTEATGYKLWDSNGIKAMLMAAKEIASNPKNYSSNSVGSTSTHLYAQNEFVLSISTNNRIAMLLESSYWENEARGTFNTMEEVGEEYGYGQRDFRCMSMPRFKGTDGIPDSQNTKSTYWGDSSQKFVFLKRDGANKEIAKEFYKFIHTRHNMAMFTVYSGTFRPYDYKVNETEMEGASKFLTNLMEKVLDPNAEVVISDQFSGFRKYSTSGDWNLATYAFKMLVDNNSNNKVDSKDDTILEPIHYFRFDAGKTVNDYWNGMKAYYNETQWAENYQKYVSAQA